MSEENEFEFSQDRLESGSYIVSLYEDKPIGVPIHNLKIDGGFIDFTTFQELPFSPFDTVMFWAKDGTTEEYRVSLLPVRMISNPYTGTAIPRLEFEEFEAKVVYRYRYELTKMTPVKPNFHSGVKLNRVMQ